MTEQNATKAMAPYDQFRTLARSKTVLEQFALVLGNGAGAYVSSVITAVGNSEELKKCTPTSILMSAMRAATLRLSVDPGIGQAYLVPYKDKATLIVGYKGLYAMALRTGKYRYLNVSRICEGQDVQLEQMRGIHTIVGSPTSKTVLGYLLYFELVSGFSKTFYMTVPELWAHADQYSASWKYNRAKSFWTTQPDMMMAKTVMRLGLMHWGIFDPNDATTIGQADDTEDDNGMVDAAFKEIANAPAEVKRSEKQNMAELGYADDGDDYMYDRQSDEPATVPAPAPTSTQAQATATQVTPVTKDAPLTLQQAESELNSKNLAYGLIDTPTLAHMANALGKLAKLTTDQERKMLACQIILADRAAKAENQDDAAREAMNE
jgi:recombination protein RecT